MESKAVRGLKSSGELFLRYDKYIILVVFLGVSTLLSNKFFTGVNIDSLLKQNSAIGIVAIAELMVILTGGIDLSVGAMTALSSIVVAILLRANVSWPLAAVITVCFGLFAGTCTGLMVTVAKLAPFIVTLSAMSIFSGLGLLLSDGRQVFYDVPSFLVIGGAGIGILPFVAVFWVVIALLVQFFLQKTVAGRFIRGIGGNKETVKLAGIKVNFFETMSYSLSGLLCSLSGVLMASRLTLGSNIVGQGWELTAIASVMVGGGNFVGGIGTVVGTIIGTIIMGLIGNIMNLTGISIFWQQIIRGLIILLAVFSSSRRGVA
jgi:ribose transport system permease protein